MGGIVGVVLFLGYFIIMCAANIVLSSYLSKNVEGIIKILKDFLNEHLDEESLIKTVLKSLNDFADKHELGVKLTMAVVLSLVLVSWTGPSIENKIIQDKVRIESFLATEGDPASSSVKIQITADLPEPNVTVVYYPAGINSQSKKNPDFIGGYFEISNLIPNCEYEFYLVQRNRFFGAKIENGSVINTSHTTAEASGYKLLYYEQSTLSVDKFNNGKKISGADKGQEAKYETYSIKSGKSQDIYANFFNTSSFDSGRILCKIETPGNDGTYKLVKYEYTDITFKNAKSKNVKIINDFNPKASEYKISLYLKPKNKDEYGLIDSAAFYEGVE